jgi:hypothetical protein
MAQYTEYEDPITGDIYRDGVRDGKWVIDVELNHDPGFTGDEDIDWENLTEIE